MRVAVLAKQVPRVESMELGPDGRARRDGADSEMNAYCRRAVSMGVHLARETSGTCTVITMGPPSAEDVIREAVAFGADRGVLVSDPRLAGADTLATAHVLARVLLRMGPFDMVLAGRNAIDADTGQVGPEVAELLDLPFAAAVRELALVPPTSAGVPAEPAAVEVRCELDDGWRRLRVVLPALLTTAERLIDPCKMPPEARASVTEDRLVRLGAQDVGPGPWGEQASPTSVGAVQVVATDRLCRRLNGPVEAQARAVVALLRQRGSLRVGAPSGTESAVTADGGGASDPGTGVRGETGVGPRGGAGVGGERDVVATARHGGRGGAVPDVAQDQGLDGPVVAVVVEPGRPLLARELLGEAAVLAAALSGTVVATGSDPGDPAVLASWGADAVLRVADTAVEEDLARALAGYWADRPPWAVLVPGTLWGREVAGRIAARLGAGLTGDAVGLRVVGGRLVCLKPAFSGRLVVEVVASSAVQMATVRPGILPRRAPRTGARPPRMAVVPGATAGRVTVLAEGRDDDVAALSAAAVVVSVGQGVDRQEYDRLAPLVDALGAELAATRKVTDRGWLPRARQVGITGHSVAPDLLVVVGSSGSANHMIGSRGARTIVAVNCDPDAPVFEWADVGMVADWRLAVAAVSELLAEEGGSAPMAATVSGARPAVGDVVQPPVTSAASISARGTPNR
ncbi:MAG: FAD-binding protein [Actinomycetota bacterium]|nr:FAD-binding protein [Actinomycetota bacterium]